MKKNLLTIIILALLVVNVVLTGIMMFSVTGAMNKTSALVTDISTALNLELDKDKQDEQGELSIADMEVYDIADQMKITLLPGEGDTKARICVVSVSLVINMKHEDYGKMKPLIVERESLIKSTINEVISGYTYDKALGDQKGMREALLVAIQQIFQSDFIIDVNFRECLIQ